MANHPMDVLYFLVLILGCYSTQSSHAYQFIVGGKDGWVLNPSENYNKWAERNRFSVNDTLLFKYNKGSDSVLVVNKNDYDNCNNGNPILKLEDGNSVFTFDRSGPFYFISGSKDNCDKGQKLIIVVLAVRNRSTPPPAASPPIGSPTTSPASSPLSPSPVAEPPSYISPSPAASPDQSPSPASPPGSSGPSSSITPGSPIPSDGSTPADSNAPGGSSTPRSFVAPSCSVPSVLILVSAVSVMLSLSLGAYI